MILPTSKAEFLAFCAAHTETWTDNAAALSLNPTAVTAWKAALGDAQIAFTAAEAARNAAKAATLNADTLIRGVRTTTAEFIRLIKNRAATSGDPDAIFALAEIDAPRPPSELPPPGQPFMLTADLNPNGSLTIRWKTNNPAGASGTSYFVQRRLGAQGSYAIVGGGTGRTFTDVTLPAGQASVYYTVQGVRGGVFGPTSEPLVVSFGIGGNGEMVMSQSFDSKAA